MEINYLEIKDRLINLYKSNAFNFENSNEKNKLLMKDSVNMSKFS